MYFTQNLKKCNFIFAHFLLSATNCRPIVFDDPKSKEYFKTQDALKLLESVIIFLLSQVQYIMAYENCTNENLKTLEYLTFL